MKSYASVIRSVYTKFSTSQYEYWVNRFRDTYGVLLQTDSNVPDPYIIARQIYVILSKIPKALFKDCGVRVIKVKDLGPNKPFYPNHGFYIGDVVGLNSDIFIHPDQPDDFMDHRNYFITRGEETFFHELAHSYDQHYGDLSLKPDWLQLSGWSPDARPGLKRLIIRDPGTPEVIGEWFYTPSAEFTRFYARKNPWDDFADSCAFYIGGLKSKVPGTKRDYLDKLFAPYYMKRQASTSQEIYRPHGADQAVVRGALRKLIGRYEGTEFWFVDGKFIRDNIDIDYVEGGNPARYTYIPQNQIWVEMFSDPGDVVPVMVHEYVEMGRMIRDGWDYDGAHEYASAIEREVRINRLPTEDYMVSFITAMRHIQQST